MSLLYKDKKDIITSLEILKRDSDDPIELTFSADCGKFGTDEILDRYTLTPNRLLQILQDRDDYTEEELL
jgi:hypothetical protein